MVTNVTSLLKTVKAVEDEHTRGTRALESTIEAIGQEIRVCFCFVLFSSKLSYESKLFRRLIPLRVANRGLPLKIWFDAPNPLRKQLLKLFLLELVTNKTILSLLRILPVNLYLICY